MSRQYGHMIIKFTNGTTQRVGGNRHVVRNDVLIISTVGNYGERGGIKNFPLANIREYHWEDE